MNIHFKPVLRKFLFKSLLPVFFCSFLLPQAVFSQSNLLNDLSFFKEKVSDYELWLKEIGFGEVLRVKEITVEDGDLSLYLSFPTSNLDSVVSYWKNMEESLLRVNSPFNIQQLLFYQLIHIMNIKEEQGIVQIYDTYDLLKPPLFFRGIYFNEGQVAMVEDNPRANVKSIGLNIDAQREYFQRIYRFPIPNYLDAQTLYDSILVYVENTFTEKTCGNEKLDLELIEKGKSLRFRINDICPTVLKNTSYSSIRRETITFNISKVSSNFITLYITGYFSSGPSTQLPRERLYPMDKNMQSYVQAYTKQFWEDLEMYFN